MIVLRWIGLLPALITLCSCALQQADVADRGRGELVGLGQDELRMCAGHPANVDKVRGGEVWMYERGATNPSDIQLLHIVPFLGFPAPEGANGYCRVQLRLVQGKVAEVTYSGATDLYGARDAVCAPVISACLKRKQASLVRQ